MSLFHADPPSRHISQPKHISAAEALSKISKYLSDSEKDEYVYLHPDCTFDARGPTRTAHGSTRGLVLHQLWRIKEGLEGKNLGEEAVLDDYDMHANGEELVEDEGLLEERDEYQRGMNEFNKEEEGEEIGEVGERNNVIGMVDEIPRLESSGGKKRKASAEEDNAVANGEKSKKKKKKSKTDTTPDEADESLEATQTQGIEPSTKREETKEERKARRRAEKETKSAKVDDPIADSTSSKTKNQKTKKEREKT